MARPSKYTDETLGLTLNYIKNHKEEFDDIVPSVAGLACVLGTCRETLHVWAKEEGKEEFSNMLKTLQSTQERILLNGGLSGENNAVITKLMLSKHGYSDKQEIEQTTTFNIADKSDEELKRIIDDKG